MEPIISKDLKTLLNVKNCTAVLLDIDDFSLFNIEYGYEFGNKALKEIERNIQKLPRIKFYKNFQSDEFLIIFCDYFENIKPYLMKIMQKIQKELRLTISIGGIQDISLFSTPENLLNGLLKNLLFVKRNGKNKILVS